MASVTAASKSGANDDNVIFVPGHDEGERLKMQHQVIFAAMPKLVQAPVDFSRSSLRILDQATASGIWLRDVRAAATGSHTWVGTDIEDAYFPKDAPEDMSFHHQSMTEPWPAEWKATFDLVHSRMALPAVGMTPLDTCVEGLIDLVKPGGYIQVTEAMWEGWDVGPAGQQLHDASYDLIKTVTGGQGVDLLEKLGPMFKEAGLEDVQWETFEVPFGAAASESVREISRASTVATAEGISRTTGMVPAAVLRFTREQLDALPGLVAKELDERGFTMVFFSLWGRRPE